MSDQAHEHELIRKSTARTTDAAQNSTPDVNPLTKLQSMIGNRAVSRMVTSDGSLIQTKLNVTAANDASEAEADAVAEQVVRKVQRSDETDSGGAGIQRAQEEDEMAMKRVQRAQEEDEMAMKRVQRAQEEDEMAMKRVQRESEGEEEEIQEKRIQRESEGEEEEIQEKRIQRESEGEEEEIQEKRIQRKGGDDMMGAFSVGGDFEKSLDSQRGGGKSMDSATAGKLGSAMGADFSGVRIHEGKEADSLNNSIQAKAFTTGSDIFFRSGEYNPSSSDGQKLLAHELTHTIQQGAVNTKREDGKS